MVVIWQEQKYRLDCSSKQESKNTKVVRTKNGRIVPLSKCAVCNSEIRKFIKEQEAKGLLVSLLGGKPPVLGNIPLVNTLF